MRGIPGGGAGVESGVEVGGEDGVGGVGAGGDCFDFAG